MLEKLYKKLVNEKGERVCKGLSDDACKHVPSNFFLIIISNLFTKLGDTLSNPKTVITWVMTAVNAPAFLISLIVPIRESGSMLPQVALSNLINDQKYKKQIWILGAFIQFLSIASIGLIVLNFEGNIAGWLIVLAIIVFSLSRSLSSLSSKDIVGKTIPKTRRGTLSGFSSSASGIMVLIAGLFIFYQGKYKSSLSFYSSILFFASSLWVIALIFYSRIKEEPTKVDQVKTEKESVVSKLKLLQKNTHFRNFVIARSLLLCSALSSPYYVILAQKHVGKSESLLGLFIVAGGVASIISSPLWGKFADRSSKNVMTLAILMASTLGISMFFIVNYSESFRSTYILYPIVMFLLGIAHEGVRLGRKTYVVDMATGNDRTNFVSVSNTVIGIILLFTAGLSALVSYFSVEEVVLILSLLGLLGAYRSFNLPNVESEAFQNAN